VALAIHDERLTRRVGAAVLAVAALTVVFVVVLLPRLERAGVDLRIRFHQVTGIAEGAPVKVAGRTIGHVRAMAMVPGGVTAIVRLDDAWAARIPINADFFVDARSPLAPRYLAIGPPPGGAEPGRAVRDGDEVTGIDPPNLDTVLQRTWDNLTELSDFLDAIRPVGHRLDDDIAHLSLTVHGLAPGGTMDLLVAQVIDESRELERAVYAGHLDVASMQAMVARGDVCASHIKAAIEELRARVAEVRAAMAVAPDAEKIAPDLRARLDRALDSADRALASADRLATSVAAVTHELASGTGSLAAFAADLELVDDVKDLTKQLKNHPWQVVAPGRP
jgi:phospholipid/cholesterol/gamma-HCH transport system substrate-binding protein